jgi:hypothetical protein
MTPTCPTCHSRLHVHGDLHAWVTADGRVVLELHSASPTQQRWLELPANAQNWLAGIMHQAGQAAILSRQQTTSSAQPALR